MNMDQFDLLRLGWIENSFYYSQPFLEPRALVGNSNLY